MSKCVCVGGVEEIGGDGKFLPTYLLDRHKEIGKGNE